MEYHKKNIWRNEFLLNTKKYITANINANNYKKYKIEINKK